MEKLKRYEKAQIALMEAALRFCRESEQGDDRGLDLKAWAREYHAAFCELNLGPK